MKLYDKKQTVNAIRWLVLVFIFIVSVMLLLVNCSSQSYFNNSGEMIVKKVLYCGTFENIIEATKKCYVIKTDKTEFIVWGKPDIPKGTYLYLTVIEETIMPTMTVKWVPYLIFNDNKYRVNEDYTNDVFYTEIRYINSERLVW